MDNTALFTPDGVPYSLDERGSALLTCLSPGGVPYYVNKYGGIKLEGEKRDRYGTRTTKINIKAPNIDGGLPVKLLDVMGATFLNAPNPSFRPVCVLNENHPDYVHGRLHSGLLAWKNTAPGKQIRRRTFKSETIIPTEHWRYHQEMFVWVSSHNRFQREGIDDTVMEFQYDRCNEPVCTFYLRIRNKKRAFHRIVAEAFMGPPPSGRNIVDHLDGDTYNNHPLNLRWCNYSENNSNKATVPNPFSGTDEFLHYPDCECAACKQAEADMAFVPARCYF